MELYIKERKKKSKYKLYNTKWSIYSTKTVEMLQIFRIIEYIQKLPSKNKKQGGKTLMYKIVQTAAPTCDFILMHIISYYKIKCLQCQKVY